MVLNLILIIFRFLDALAMFMCQVVKKMLDDKSFQCVLLGVSEESKAYRLYRPASEKIVVSRDVVFEENICWN